LGRNDRRILGGGGLRYLVFCAWGSLETPVGFGQRIRHGKKLDWEAREVGGAGGGGRRGMQVGGHGKRDAG